MKFFEVFKAGTYPQGTFSASQVEALANNYDPSFCEAPITLDHQQSGPAYGWVKDLKAEGGKLKANFKDISDELKEFVQSGKYKKISVEIYRELEGKKPYLKAVSFLGASIPQVKGMNAVEFKEGESDTYTFEIAEKSEKKDFSAIQEQLNSISENISKFSQSKDNKELSEGLKTQLDEIKEKISSFEQDSIDKKRLQKEIDNLKQDIKDKDFEQFLDSQIEEGKLTPANRDVCLEILKELDNVRKFDSASDAIENFKSFISALPKQIEFEEIATKKKKADSDGEFDEFSDASDESKEFYKEAMELSKKENIDFKDALLKLQE